MGSATGVLSSHLQVETLPYDERPLPATRKQQAEVPAEPDGGEADLGTVRRGGVSGEPEPLSEKALREASSAVDVLGETLVKKETATHVCVHRHTYREEGGLGSAADFPLESLLFIHTHVLQKCGLGFQVL